MTPMQSLKNQFDLFKTLLPAVFKEVALNKSEARTYVDNFCGDQTEHFMKGVRSDFIKTFKAKFNDKDSYSIGFSFQYLEVPDNAQTVQVSLKIGNREPLYYAGEQLSVDDFRKAFVGFLEQLQKAKPADCTDIVYMVKESFGLLASLGMTATAKSHRRQKSKM